MRNNKLAEMVGGNACILLATLFWGVNVPVTKALIPEWMSADGVSAIRLIGGCALFWIVSTFTTHRKVDRADWIKFISAGVFGLFGFIYLFVKSLSYGDPIDISIIMTLSPVIVILVDVIFKSARPSIIEYAGVITSFAGAIIVILDAGGDMKAGSDRLLGDALALASAICYAVYLVVLESPSKVYRPVTMLRWVFLFAAIPGLLLIQGMSEMPIISSAEISPWLEISFILLCPTFMAYFLVQPAIKRIGSELVSIYQYLVPVVAAIASVAMGIGDLRWMQIAAMAVIIVGMVVTTLAKRRSIRRTHVGE